MASPMELASLNAYSGSSARPSTRQLRVSLYRDAAAIVREEFARPLTLDEVARRVATSPRQLRRAFAEVGGTSFRSYLLAVRMARAAALLATSDLPVAEVGRRVGYRQPGQFAKAFKRARGTTPSEFRSARGRG
jgi:AraC family transcriptional regulator, regulatory protein of adaptative response / methylphosphotriester-DNA alkyltransferase methyltransferase